MEPKKINAKALEKLLESLKKGEESASGIYLYKGLRIQISKYKSTSTERYMKLYRKRREAGLCIRCGEKVKDKNPRTGKLYRLCNHHRETTDKKNRPK